MTGGMTGGMRGLGRMRRVKVKEGACRFPALT